MSDTWFAWIPVLGERLLWPASFSNNNRYGRLVKWDKIELELEKLKASIGGSLFGYFLGEAKSRFGDYLFCLSTEQIDDTNRVKTIRLMVFELEQDGFHKPKWALFAQSVDGKEYVVNTLAKIDEFDRDGLYSFELKHAQIIPSLGDSVKPHIASEIHRRIRDFFHQHIYNTSDATVLPVNTSDKNKAVRIMWEEYFGGKIGILGKRQVTSWLKTVAGVQCLSPWYPYWAGRKEYAAIYEICPTISCLIKNYLGKCLYGKSFCMKLLPNHLESTKRLDEMFHICFEHLDSILESRTAKDTFMLSRTATKIAALALIVTILTPFWSWLLTTPTPSAEYQPVKKVLLKPSGDTKNLGQATSTSQPAPAGKSEDTISRMD